jgi:hypothetical protein
MQLSATRCIKSHNRVLFVLNGAVATFKNIDKIGGYLKTPP